MKKIVKKRTFLCVMLTAMLVLGSHTEKYVYAAPDDDQAETATTKETLSKEDSSKENLPKENLSKEDSAKEDSAKETLSKETLSKEDSSKEDSSKENTLEAPAVPTLTDEELTAYYSDSVFIGDSIMLGFRNYSAKQESYVHNIQFLAVGSYSALNAMKPVTSDSVHPMYKGKKYQVWNAIPLLSCKRAFILLGMNDISILGLEGARDQYKELIDKILETSPDIEIHIISVTYTLPDQGKGKLNNENIAQYNILLQEMAEENGWEYIDLCTLLSDGKGNLDKQYCSDGYVHLSNTAYALWESALIDYATIQSAKSDTDTENTAENKDSKSKMETILEADTSQSTKGR